MKAGEKKAVTLQHPDGPKTLHFEALDDCAGLPPAEAIQAWYERYGCPRGGQMRLGRQGEAPIFSVHS